MVWMEYKVKTNLDKDNSISAQPGDIRVMYLASAWPGSRGTGQSHAQGLLAKFLQQKASQNVWLWVGEENGRARRFYERNGFEEQGAKEKDNVRLLLLNHCAVAKDFKRSSVSTSHNHKQTEQGGHCSALSGAMNRLFCIDHCSYTILIQFYLCLSPFSSLS